MVCFLLPKFLKQKIRQTFTKAQPESDMLFEQPSSHMGMILVFLIKCAVCILLVFVALQWRADNAPGAKQSAVARHEKQQKPGGIVEDVASLLRAGGDALAGAARDKCLAAPRDCLSAAQRLQSAAGHAH
jgi:hypothetical protein